MRDILKLADMYRREGNEAMAERVVREGVHVLEEREIERGLGYVAQDSSLGSGEGGGGRDDGVEGEGD